jgi:type I restriction enzyme M protein
MLAKDLIEFIEQNTEYRVENTGHPTLNINGNQIIFYVEDDKFDIPNLKGCDHRRIFDLKKPENHSVVMLMIKLFRKGYSAQNIYLEKHWASGRNTSDYLDVMIVNPDNNDIIMIEVKTFNEFILQYSDPNRRAKINQLTSYIMHERTTKIGAFYTYNFDERRDCFNNIFCDEIRQAAANNDDFYAHWNKVFTHDDFIVENDVFGIQRQIKKIATLQPIQNAEAKNLFSQFLTILRLNSISDKPNAFMKVINLFLCKIADETTEDKDFDIVGRNGNTHCVNGLKFQFVDDLDTAETFMKRLNELYKIGMMKYLNKDIIEYTDNELNLILDGHIADEIMQVLNNLRLKREHNFAFIEVYNDDTFLENFMVVKDVVRLLENYRFKYETKHQFLGDFFESLLNTSLKQEAGQFFTPYPIVDYMICSLSFDRKIDRAIQNNEADFVPSVIDYACGAGHFLVSAMAEIQKIISDKTENDFRTAAQKTKFRQYTTSQYSWINGEKIVGIEKDYRLAKTTKIATFLNGDGDAAIISGDGINKFSAREYVGTPLSTTNKNLNKFDYVVSNPPYSVDGFMQSFRKNGIDKNSNDFTLLTDELNDNNAEIESYFVERAYQLLKNGGMAALILPQSILSSPKYEKLRKYILGKFVIKSMLLTADITFSGTTTSPVILFLQKQTPDNLDYNILINMSPKYMIPTASRLKRKEELFLGYSFSSNRNKAGIYMQEHSILKDEITPITAEFINTGNAAGLGDYSKIVRLSDILLNRTNDYVGDIYPKYERIEGQALGFFCKINTVTKNDFTNNGLNVPTSEQYLEIGDIAEQIPTKTKTSHRFCKQGDILVSALTPTPEHIVIARNNFMLTNAIYVLSDFESDEIRDKVYNALKTDIAIKQMNTLLDGFKVTYAKIKESNLMNNVFITV